MTNTKSSRLAFTTATLIAAMMSPMAAYANGYAYSDLYVLQGEELYRVHPGNGTPTLIGSNDDWAGFTSLTSDGGTGAYAIQGDSIWRISFHPGSEGAYTLVSDDEWTGTTNLAYGSYHTGGFPGSNVYSLIARQGNYLYRVNPSTGAVSQLGSAPWAGLKAMSYLDHNHNNDGNDLFVVQDDALWRVNVHTGAYTQLNGDWSDTTAMTTDGTSLYIACQNHLYKVSPATGSSTDLGDDWNTTTTLTFLGGWLYAIDGGDLYSVSPSTGSTSLVGSADEWPGFTLMTHREFSIPG